MARPRGWYADVEGERLAWMATQHPEYPAVEIGTSLGRSISYVLEGSSAPVVCIDSWPDTQVWDAFCTWTRDWPDRVTAIRAASSDAEWEGPIGVLHIDGSHAYEDVLADYYKWGPLVVDKGWLAFHDSQWPTVRRVIREELGKQWTPAGVTQSLWTAQRG